MSTELDKLVKFNYDEASNDNEQVSKMQQILKDHQVLITNLLKSNRLKTQQIKWQGAALSICLDKLKITRSDIDAWIAEQSSN